MGEIVIPTPERKFLFCAHVQARPDEILHWAVAEFDGTLHEIGICVSCATRGVAGVRKNAAGKPVIVLAE